MLASLITQLVDFLHLHPNIAYGAVFFLAMSESLPVFGALVPGTAIIITLSTLVPSGVLVVWPLLGAATLGAIAGDGFSFWLGHHYHRQILSAWPFSRYPAAIKHSETFFAKYGNKSVFFARFLPGVRAFVPVLAGTLGMQIARFYAVNIFSAAVWAPVHILPGVLFGATLHALGPAAKPFGALLVTLAILSWLLIHAVRYALRKGMPILETAAETMQEKLATRQDRASRFAVRLLDPAGNELRAIGLLIIIIVMAAWLFFGILEDVFTGDPLVNADAAVYHLLQGFRSYPSDTVMVSITELGDTTVVVAITISVLAYLLWARAKHSAIFFASALAGASLINTAIKVALHRSRPVDGLYTGWSAFSFPSGHSTANMVLYGAIAFLIVRHGKGRLAVTAPFVACIAILAIAFSRLYLGAHWFSDVVGGMAFGLTWLALLVVPVIRRPKETLNAVVLATIPVIILSTVGVGHAISRHKADMARYAVQNNQSMQSFEAWWTFSGRMAQLRRIDLTGEQEEPYILEWAGPLEPLQKALLNAGWEISNSWTLGTATRLMNGAAASKDIPAYPLLASGRLADLVMIHSGAEIDLRLVLRFWTEDARVSGQHSAALWKATITKEHIARPIGIAAYPQEDGDGSEDGLPLLIDALKKASISYTDTAGFVKGYDNSVK
jgi:membrane protein DedA with SNARE-associated domain/membrane-associated phospholipid phosphatase